MSLDELYQEIILNHFRNPRCHGCLPEARLQSQVFNPLCGDQVALSLDIANGRITKLGFDGKGCSISQASTSMMASICEGKTVTEVQDLLAQFRALMRGEKTADEVEVSLGDAAVLQGVRKFSSRIKCAMLGWEALERCIKQNDTSENLDNK